MRVPGVSCALRGYYARFYFGYFKKLKKKYYVKFWLDYLLYSDELENTMPFVLVALTFLCYHVFIMQH